MLIPVTEQQNLTEMGVFLSRLNCTRGNAPSTLNSGARGQTTTTNMKMGVYLSHTGTLNWGHRVLRRHLGGAGANNGHKNDDGRLLIQHRYTELGSRGFTKAPYQRWTMAVAVRICICAVQPHARIQLALLGLCGNCATPCAKTCVCVGVCQAASLRCACVSARRGP